jgi:hypothetical protein
LQSFVRVGRCYYVASAVLQERGRDIEHKRIVINDKHNARQEHLKQYLADYSTALSRYEQLHLIGTRQQNWRYEFVRKQLWPLGILIVGHAAVGAILGVIAWIVIMACADSGLGAFASIHDPIANVVLLCTLSALLAVGSGISAFILINVERASANKQLSR